MAQLIHMRQRIKAIETIKKVTHAMRLIAMSSHSNLRNKQNAMKRYTEKIETLAVTLQAHDPEWRNPILHPDDKPDTNPLVIIIGSQKGLCGGFNNSIFQLFTKESKTELLQKAQIFVIGKKIIDLITPLYGKSIIDTHAHFTIRTLPTIAHEITNQIVTAPRTYSSVHVMSNKLKSFFSQIPMNNQLIPLATAETPPIHEGEEYEWEQEPSILLNGLVNQYLEAHIQNYLFQSLIAEHAARFLSMDGSTRNADSLLETTRLQYNKLRQAKITKELTELSGCF